VRYILLLTMFLASHAFAVPDFYETKAAAKQGDAYAQFNLALMFNSGIGIPESTYA
jgi:TPR repeat protein